MSSLQNQVVWITGASSGIGRAVAIEFASRGARVVLSARREAALEAVKQDIGQDDRVMVLPLDLERPETFPALVTQVIAEMGRIDVVVHNGGVSQRGLAAETDLEVDRRLININYLGAVALTKAVLPHFTERKSGQFAVITSLVGIFGTPMRTGYSASKHALHGFFDALRAEVWKSNIGVTLIAPGFIKTDVSVNAFGPDGKPTGKMFPAQANGMPVEKCARKVVKAIERRKRQVLIGGKEKRGVYLKRFFPGILSRVLRTATVT